MKNAVGTGAVTRPAERNSANNSECELRGELHSAWSAASQKWVANAHVSGCSQRIKSELPAKRSSRRIRIRRARVGNKVGQNRAGEVRVVKQIEELRP